MIALNANARSLGPKVDSLADCMHEIEADIGIITETWLQDRSVNDATIDMAGQHGLDLFTLNRQNIAANGRQYGGVAVTCRTARATMKKMEMPNPENFEVLCIAGKVQGIKEKVVTVAVYIPPNYPKHRADSCLEYVADVVSEAKREYQSPFIIVGGDWNQWPIESISQEHPDLVEVEHGPTRQLRKIDRFLVNFNRSICESDTLPPLDDGQGRESDHLVAFFKASIEKQLDPKVSYTYRHFTDEGADRFQDCIANTNFAPIFSLEDVNEQVDFLSGKLEKAMSLCFPTKTTTRREKDPPWINHQVRALAKKRRKIYHREGRSHQWKAMMKKSRILVKLRAGRYWEHQKKVMLQPDANRAFFKNVKAYSSREPSY